MPPNVVRSAEQERLWNKAKAQAKKQGREGDYAYVMGIFKRMGGLEKTMGLLVGDQLKSMDDLRKSYFGSIARGSEDWAGRFIGFGDLYLQALQCLKDRAKLARDRSVSSKQSLDYDELQELPRSQRDQERKKQRQKREAFDERSEKITERMADLEMQLIDARIKQEKEYIEGRDRGPYKKSEGLEGLGDFLEKGAKVIAIGKKGGKIVGYKDGKPIYQHEGGAEAPQKTVEPPKETKAETASLETAAQLLDAAIQKQDLPATRKALEALKDLAGQKGNKGKVMSELRAQLKSARAVAKTMDGREQRDRRKPPKGREPWTMDHVATARSIRDWIDNTRAEVAEQGKSEATKEKQAKASVKKSITYRQKKLDKAKGTLKDFFEKPNDRYARVLAPGAIRDSAELHKELADLHKELGDEKKAAEHIQLQNIASEALGELKKRKEADAAKVKTAMRQLAGLEQPKVSEHALAEKHGQMRLFKGLASLDEYLSKGAGSKYDDDEEEDSSSETEESSVKKGSKTMKESKGRDCPDMGKGCGSSQMEKSEGLEAMSEYLSKAVGSDESGGKKPSAKMPTGNPPGTMPTSGSTETNTAQEGGPVDGVGETKGPNTQPASHQKRIGCNEDPKIEVLSSDDAIAAKYVEEGYMGEGMKKSDLAQRNQFTRHELDTSVARERAQKVARLRKGEADLELRGHRPHPLSYSSFHGGTDQQVEELSKSEFYHGVSPTIAPPRSISSQSVLCKSCEVEHSAMLTACPHCGEGVVPPGMDNGKRGSVILEKAIHVPYLTPARKEDLKIG